MLRRSHSRDHTAAAIHALVGPACGVYVRSSCNACMQAHPHLLFVVTLWIRHYVRAAAQAKTCAGKKAGHPRRRTCTSIARTISPCAQISVQSSWISWLVLQCSEKLTIRAQIKELAGLVLMLINAPAILFNPETVTEPYIIQECANY